MTVARRAAFALLRRHSRIAPFLPKGHRAYPGPGGWIYLDLRESPMMLARLLRVYEERNMKALRQTLRPGGVFLDVGANKGDFSLVAAKLMGDRGRVIAVEPEPANAAWIARSVARNRYRCVEVAQVALADRAGEETLHLGMKSGWHSLLSTEGVPTAGEMTVPVQTLDELLHSHGVERVDVVKIDVEGAEDRVLDGATNAFSGSHPMTLLLDLHPRRGIDPVAVCGRLEAWGFSLRDPGDVSRPLGTGVHAKTESVLAVR